MTLAATRIAVPGRLRAADVEFRPGEITAICGPNGAGKSTLLASLAGLIAPAEGAVSLDGKPLSAIPSRERARQIGYLPQSREIAWDVDVRTLVGLGRLPWRAGVEADRAAVSTALETLDLHDLADRPITRLSGGEQARALLGRVLAGEPRWILADEPLAALDLAHQATLMRHFRALAKRGLGVVLVLHDLAAAMNGADRVVVLEHGAVVAAGPPREALSPDRLRQTWGVDAEWLSGEAGFAVATRY